MPDRTVIACMVVFIFVCSLLELILFNDVSVELLPEHEQEKKNGVLLTGSVRYPHRTGLCMLSDINNKNNWKPF